MTFHLMVVKITFNSVSVAEWSPFGKELGKNCPLGLPYVLFVL